MTSTALPEPEAYGSATQALHWIAAASTGLYQSADGGKTWRGGPIEGERAFTAVTASGELIIAVGAKAAVLSPDGGRSWSALKLPDYVTNVHSAAIVDKNTLWLATREGALRTDDGGKTWEHILGGLPSRYIERVAYQAETRRLFTVAQNGDLYVSRDQGESWKRAEAGFAVRNLAFARHRLLAATTFDGVIYENDPTPSAGGGQK